MGIGERLKGILKCLNISAKDFSSMIGVTEGMVYKYYKMESVDFDTLNKWAGALYIPIITFTDDYQYRRKVGLLTDEEKNIEEEQHKLYREEQLLFKEYKTNKKIFAEKEALLNKRINDLEYIVNLQKKIIEDIKSK